MSHTQDKMHADVPAQMLQELFDAAIDAGNLLFLPWRDIREMRNQSAERINSAIAAIRSLPCAQQSAQSQQDALDAARWREAILHIGGVRYEMQNLQQFTISQIHPIKGVNILQGSVAEHFTRAIDAAIATQGASNV